MEISALLLACSVHADDALLSSLAYVHGRGSPFAVINVRPQAFDDLAEPSVPSSAAAARLDVHHILSAGGVPALGLLPVLPEWAAEYGKSTDDLFDPCSDIQVASAKLSEFDYSCKGRGQHHALRRRSCILELYGAALGLPALRRAVLADLTLQNPFPAAAAGDPSAPAPAAPTFPPSSGLFFAVTPPAAPRPISDGSPSPLPSEDRSP